MNLLVNSFTKIKNSIYSPSFYHQIPKIRLSSTIGYFSLLILLLTLLKTIFISPNILADTSAGIEGLVNDAVSMYPKELEVTIQNGVAGTNVQEPFFIPLTNQATVDEVEYQNILVIDTQAPFSVNQFNEYRSIAWLTRDAFFFRSNRDRFDIRSFDLTKINNLTINKDVVSSIVDNFKPYIKFIGPILLILIFIGTYLIFLFRLLYILILALIIWGITKLLKKKLTYGNSVKVGIFAMTLGLIVEIIISVLNIQSFPFMFSLITLAVVFINLQNSHTKQSA